MKLRPRENQDHTCAVCRDGPEGLVICRGCGTFIHASCLIDVRGCPTIGCNEKDPLQERPRPGPYGAIQGGDADAVNAAISDQTKEFDDLVRAEKGPQKEPPCNHKFSPMDNRCVYCREDMMEHARKTFGSTYVGVGYSRTLRPTGTLSAPTNHRRPAEGYGASFVRQKLAATDRARRIAKTKRQNKILGVIVLVLGFLFGLIQALIGVG